MEETLITIIDPARMAAEAGVSPVNTFELPEAPMAMPPQNLSPARASWLTLLQWLRPHSTVRS